jgi:hypothetical protein
MESIFSQSQDKANETNETDPQLLAQLKGGANWFYWVAGLSLVNSIIFAFGGNVSFILGLAVTQVVDGLVDVAIASGAPSAVKAFAIVLDLIIAAMFGIFGYFAHKGIGLAFIIGIVIYILDGLVYLIVGDILAAGFHAFALFFIFRGFLARRRLATSATAV